MARVWPDELAEPTGMFGGDLLLALAWQEC